MNEEETKKYKKGLLMLGILSEDTHGEDAKGRTVQVQTQTMPLDEALSSAHAVADISNSFFDAGLKQGHIKLRY